MTTEERDKKVSDLIARAWTDDAFKQQLLQSPAATLQAEGLELPPGIQVRIVENTDKVLHLVLPPKPVEELSDEVLETVTGGYGYTYVNPYSPTVGGTGGGVYAPPPPSYSIL